MAFSTKQVAMLLSDVAPSAVSTRMANGRELSYIEGWFAISEANRIFGFDGWNRETIEAKCVFAKEHHGNYHAIYITKVRVIVNAKGRQVIREGQGTGQGFGMSLGEAHDTAIKTAETDATKRALATFGKPFGLALYGRAKASGSDTPSVAHVPVAANVGRPRVSLPPDDTTPIPRPSRYYGRSRDPVTTDRARAQSALPKAPEAPALAPQQSDASPGKIDKSALRFGEPRRIRDKVHLQFVASHPCLVCKRLPSDAHHLRFAQPRALGVKVSDEYTVPLCREHHCLLHQAGNELAWWHNHQIKPLPIAKDLWGQSHPAAPLADDNAGLAVNEPAGSN